MYYSKKKCDELINEWMDVTTQLNELKERQKTLASNIVIFYEHMEKDEKSKVHTNLYSFKPVYMVNQTRFDQSEFKKDHLDLYNKYKRPIANSVQLRRNLFKKVGD